jgi:hypothetical protein
MGEKWPVNLACDSDFHVNHRVLLHAANLRHGDRQLYFSLTHRSIAAGPLCCAVYFRPSSPEALHVMRHEGPLLVKDRIMGEK